MHANSPAHSETPARGAAAAAAAAKGLLRGHGVGVYRQPLGLNAFVFVYGSI